MFSGPEVLVSPHPEVHRENEVAAQVSGYLALAKTIVYEQPYQVERADIIEVPLARGNRLILLDDTGQKGGSFKYRGGTAGVHFGTEEATAQGDTVTSVHIASAGNAAKGTFHAAKKAGIRDLYVHCRRDISSLKKEQLHQLGAKVLGLYDTLGAALLGAERQTSQAGNLVVHPFDDVQVIAGQATLGAEAAEAIQALDTPLPKKVVVPIGGGGLAAGFGVALQEACLDNTTLHGAEIVRLDPNTLKKLRKEHVPWCDGTATITGNITGRILKDRAYVQEIREVPANLVAGAMLKPPVQLNHDIEPATAVG
jgi:threonine dehydratase